MGQDQSAQDNYANQNNPNNSEYHGTHANVHNPSSSWFEGPSSGGCSVKDHVSPQQAANDHPSNQMNPINSSYHGGKGSK